MRPIQATKKVLLVPPQLKDNGVPSGLTYVDTAGWEHVEFEFVIGTTDIATTAAPKITECETAGGSYTDVTGAALADAISATEADSIFLISVDLTKAHMRYMKPSITAGDGTAGTNLCVIATLSRPIDAPRTAAQRGLAEWIKA